MVNEAHDPTNLPRILIVAQNASARFGGEAFLPLKYFRILKQRGHPVQLIAHSRNRAELQEILSPWMADIFFVRDSIFHRVFWRIGRLTPARVEEVVFGNILNLISEIYQARIIRRLVRAGAVDVIHQPIPVSPRSPSTLYGFGVPVVIGPMNGGMTYPAGYEDLEGRFAQRLVVMSRSAAGLINWLIPGKRRAAALLVANHRTERALPVAGHPNVIRMIENGVDFKTWARPQAIADRPPDGSFRLVFVGRLIALKAVDITLEALTLARAAGVDARLDILGDGPELHRLETRSHDLGLGDAVRFHGFLPQARCAEIMLRSDALILNSVRECGGAVVLEAMSLGLPVIAADWGGPADYIDQSCGLLISPTPRSSFADRLSRAMLQLARDPEMRRRMGEAGAQKVRAEFDWETKVDQMLQICEQVRVKPPSPSS